MEAGDAGPTEPRVNPRTRRVQQLILDTAVNVLREQGAPEVTAHRVAERCDVARTTIYRYWPDQKALLLATIDSMMSPHFDLPEFDDLGDELKEVLSRLRTRLIFRDVRSVFGAIAAHAATDDGFADAQRRFVEMLAQPIAGCLAVGKDRGELDSDLDVDSEANHLTAPILQQYLFRFQDVSDELITETVDRWLAAHRRRQP